MIEHVHILKTIELIRNSFTNSVEVYTKGSCVRLCLLLLHLYPNGKILYDMDHAIFEYAGSYFDIEGITVKTDNHISLEEYGLLQIEEILNLKY